MNPLSTDENIRAVPSLRKGTYSMPGMELYNDYYGIGLRRTGESVIITLGKTVVVSPGDFILIDKNLYHRSEYISEDIVTGSRVQFNDLAVKNLIEYIGQKTFENLLEQVVIHLNEESIQKVSSILNEMEREYAHFDEHSNFVLEGLLNHLFIEVIRGQKKAATASIPDAMCSDILLSALQYMEQHFFEDPSLESLASAVNVSPGHLSRLFTLRLGTSYSTFLLNYKIKHAQRLLTKTTLSITDVAEQSGFGSCNYFCYAFKKNFGVSPLQYRKQYSSQ